MTSETVYSVELVSRMTYLSADSLRDTYRGTLRRNVPSIPVTRGSARSPSGLRAGDLWNHLAEASFLPCGLAPPESSGWGLSPLESSHAMRAVGVDGSYESEWRWIKWVSRGWNEFGASWGAELIAARQCLRHCLVRPGCRLGALPRTGSV